jgi:hypothetical protein
MQLPKQFAPVSRDLNRMASVPLHGGVSASCTCNAAGNVTSNTCGPRYKPHCYPNQATGAYSCNCV